MTRTPTLRDEAWRYSSAKAIARLTFPPERQTLAVSSEQTLVEVVSSGTNGHLITIAEGARLNHVRIFPSDLSSPAYATAKVEVAANGYYSSHVLNLAGEYVRNEIEVDLVGAGAHANLQGVYMISDKAHCDTMTKIHHAVADTTSDEVYKGVLKGTSRGVFQAQIRVAPDAQRIVGNQMHRALMLSDDSRVDTKPELEIFANDVQCSHGSTISDLDEQQLFYLRSRGLPEANARALLIRAFLAEFLDGAPTALEGVFEEGVEAYLRGL